MTSATSTVAEARTTRTADVRGPVLALIVFLAVLPLEWTTVAGVSGGFIKPFHAAAIMLVLICLARWRPGRIVAPVWRRHLKIFAAYFVFLAVALAAALARPDALLSLDLVVRQIGYAATAVVIAGSVVLLVDRPAKRWLVWSGVLATLVLMTGFGVALIQQHINPFSLIARAVTQADPDIISYQLLRAVFRTDVDLPDVAASLRHKVFIGLLVAVFVGLAFAAALERRNRVIRVGLNVGSALGFTLVLLSLSRSTIVCMLAPLVFYLLRLVVRDRARPAQTVALVLAVAASVAVALSPLGALITARFSDTGSYTARLTAAGPSFVEEFGRAALLGTNTGAVGTTPHNSILNAWLAGGVLAAVAAAIMIVAFSGIWLREVRRYVTDRPGWVLEVGHLWVLAIGWTFIVRAFTSGNQFHMVDLTAMALFLGVTFANERAATSRTVAP